MVGAPHRHRAGRWARPRTRHGPGQGAPGTRTWARHPGGRRGRRAHPRPRPASTRVELDEAGLILSELVDEGMSPDHYHWRYTRARQLTAQGDVAAALPLERAQHGAVPLRGGAPGLLGDRAAHRGAGGQRPRLTRHSTWPASTPWRSATPKPRWRTRGRRVSCTSRSSRRVLPGCRATTTLERHRRRPARPGRARDHRAVARLCDRAPSISSPVPVAPTWPASPLWMPGVGPSPRASAVGAGHALKARLDLVASLVAGRSARRGAGLCSPMSGREAQAMGARGGRRRGGARLARRQPHPAARAGPAAEPARRPDRARAGGPRRARHRVPPTE